MINRSWIRFRVGFTAILFLTALSFSLSAEEVRALRTVVIDAGHGGHDPGAVSGGVREKDIVLDLALRLGERIKTVYPEVKVLYTRDKDIFIPLFQRSDFANRNKADLFISIHANYVSSPAVSGTETFTLGLHSNPENLEVAKKENSVILLEDDYSANYEGFDPREAESYIMFENLQSEYQGQSIDFAANIQRQFGKNLNLNDRGVKQAGFLVLRRASMPSVLVEAGFISNPNERKFLVSDAGKEKITESIFQAFSSYKKTIDERSRFSLAIASQPAGTNAEKKTEDTQTGNVNSKNIAETKPAASIQDTKTETKATANEATPLPGSSSGQTAAEPVAKQAAQSSGTNGQPSTTGNARKVEPQGSAATNQPASSAAGTQPVQSASVQNQSTVTASPKNSDIKSVANTPQQREDSPSGLQNKGSGERWYSVQVAATLRLVEVTPANFKGETNIVRLQSGNLNKYLAGRFNDIQQAIREKNRLKTKFPDSFVVVVENGVSAPAKF
jgi:N-acetylmuramoyl-L-alanine amidase